MKEQLSTLDRRSVRLRIAVFAVLLSMGATFSIVTSSLLGRATASQTRRQLAAELEISVRKIDGLEWRAVAGEDAGQLEKRVAMEAVIARETLAGISSPGSEVDRALNTYIAAVNDELEALKRSDTERAVEIDEQLVDPAFLNALELTLGLSSSAERESARNLAATRALIWLASAAFVALFGGSIWALQSLRVRDRSRRSTEAAERRFRSLVESSSDVITVVDGAGTLSLMSPSLGSLAEFASSETPTSVSDLIPASDVPIWELGDQHLRETRTSQKLDLELTRTDGSVASFEVLGTPLDGDVSERVWTWRDISERKQLETELAHQAFHDTLTGLPNRVLLNDRISHALTRSTRTAQPTTVLFCDLDDFKRVNDTMGHAAGDELLAVVAKRLSSCLRPTDTIARFGGDEFVVLLEDLDTQSATALAERMISVTAYEVELRDRTILPSLSIGIAAALPGSTAEELLRCADTALYEAKRSGKSRTATFTPDMNKTSAELLDYQADLANALANGELSLHYQPTIDLASGVVEGVEALLRWQHTTRGSISPMTFIPVAEATGLIVPIGRWVLAEAITMAARLRSTSPEALSMHVNLSPRQLHDPELVSLTRELLLSSGLPAQLLVLEVTEGILLDDSTAIQRLRELRELGLRVAIDDFGTGYTSINYLQQLPVDILKIDRSFVSGDALASTERAAFLHAIVHLAKSLSLHAVAEGVEAIDQLEELRLIGCDAGQGFLWSPATPSHELLATIESINNKTRDANRANNTHTR